MSTQTSSSKRSEFYAMTSSASATNSSTSSSPPTMAAAPPLHTSSSTAPPLGGLSHAYQYQNSILHTAKILGETSTLSNAKFAAGRFPANGRQNFPAGGFEGPGSGEGGGRSDNNGKPASSPENGNGNPQANGNDELSLRLNGEWPDVPRMAEKAG